MRASPGLTPMGEPPLKLIVTGAIAGAIASVIAGLFLAWLARKPEPSPHGSTSVTTGQKGLPVAGSESRSTPKPPVIIRPNSGPKPKPMIAHAGEFLTVDGLTFVMSKCGNTSDYHWLKCEGKVVNGGDDRLTIRLTGGVATDDTGKQSGLTPYQVGSMAGTFLGAADNSSSELTPGVPVQFGFVLKWKSYATAYSVDLGFSMSGPQPTARQISFINIPVSD